MGSDVGHAAILEGRLSWGRYPMHKLRRVAENDDRDGPHRSV